MHTIVPDTYGPAEVLDLRAIGRNGPVAQSDVKYGVSKMISNRRTAVVTGVVFIIATVAALAAAALAPVLTGSDYLTQVSANSNQVALSALMYLIAAFASAGIAVSLYPLLSRTNPGMAIGSVVFRTLEAALYLVPVVALLSLVTLAQLSTSAGAANQASLGALGGLLVSLRDHSTLAGVFAFSLGAGMYYYAFFQSRLIPRWLSAWGIVAVGLMAAACVSSLFTDHPVTGYALLVLPIALQEMVLAVWLIAKGFSSTAVAPSGVAIQPALSPA
jgi:hypothetical protein